MILFYAEKNCPHMLYEKNFLILNTPSRPYDERRPKAGKTCRASF